LSGLRYIPRTFRSKSRERNSFPSKLDNSDKLLKGGTVCESWGRKFLIIPVVRCLIMMVRPLLNRARNRPSMIQPVKERALGMARSTWYKSAYLSGRVTRRRSPSSSYIVLASSPHRPQLCYATVGHLISFCIIPNTTISQPRESGRHHGWVGPRPYRCVYRTQLPRSPLQYDM